MESNRLTELFDRYHQGIASAAETDELMALLQHLPDEALADLLRTAWNRQDINQVFFSAQTKEKLLNRLPQQVERPAVIRSLPTGRTWFLRMAAAAVVVLMLSVTAFLLLHKKDNSLARRTAPKQEPITVTNPIVPGRDQAVLTLADGRQIVLDTASNGHLAQQGGVKVIKLNGQITYDSKQPATALLYNTISTPRGGQYQLELADGTKVWLNAASSLRFPTAFSGNNRTVELTGEGYFEVAHNAAMPFHVKVNDMDVKVLGTHFNINSYADEPAIRTTLLEGKVEIVNRESAIGSRQSIVLKPGEQGVLTHDARLTIHNNVDVEEVMAWKDGRFLYNSADIETVMRQIARWYDVDVVYEKRSNETISGGLPRSENVAKLLQILEATGKVNFEIKGKQIIVRPK